MRKSVEVGLFRRGVGHFERRFQREGSVAHQPLLVPEYFTAPVEGFLCNDLRKVLRGGQRMGKVDNDEETLSKISAGRAVSESDCPFVWHQNICSALFRFVTIHACDRQTHRHTDGQTEIYDSQDRPRICSRGKNGREVYRSITNNDATR